MASQQSTVFKRMKEAALKNFYKLLSPESVQEIEKLGPAVASQLSTVLVGGELIRQIEHHKQKEEELLSLCRQLFKEPYKRRPKNEEH